MPHDAVQVKSTQFMTKGLSWQALESALQTMTIYADMENCKKKSFNKEENERNFIKRNREIHHPGAGNWVLVYMAVFR